MGKLIKSILTYRGKKTDFKNKEEILAYKEHFDKLRRAQIYGGRHSHNNNIGMKFRANKTLSRMAGLYEFYSTEVWQMDPEAQENFLVLSQSADKGLKAFADFEDDPDKFYLVSNAIRDQENIDGIKFAGNEICELTLIDLDQDYDKRYLGPGYDNFANMQY